MANCYVKAYFDWIEQTAALSDAERGRLFVGVLEYARAGTLPELGGRESILFPVFKAQIDRDNQISAARADAGKNGVEAKVSKRKQKLANASKIANKEKDKEEDKDKDKDKDKEATKARASAFVPPTAAEVVEYAVSKGKDFDETDAEMFVGYYESKDWKVGKDKMTSWHGALSGWIARDEKRRKPF